MARPKGDYIGLSLFGLWIFIQAIDVWKGTMQAPGLHKIMPKSVFVASLLYLCAVCLAAPISSRGDPGGSGARPNNPALSPRARARGVALMLGFFAIQYVGTYFS